MNKTTHVLVVDHGADPQVQIECSNPALCNAWEVCDREDHPPMDDEQWNAIPDEEVFEVHGREHIWMDEEWWVRSEVCAAYSGEATWDLPDDVDTSIDGRYPVKIDWDDEDYLIVTRVS